MVEFTPELAELEPEEFARSYLEAIGAESSSRGAASASAGGRGGDLALLERLGLRTPVVAAGRGRLVDARSGGCSRRRRARRGALLGRPAEVEGIVVAATRAAARSGSRPRISASSGTCSCRAFGIYAGLRARPSRRDLDRRQPALRRRRAARRGVPARLRGRPLRAAARRRALAAAPRRGGVRERGGARRADRARRRRRARAPRRGPAEPLLPLGDLAPAVCVLPCAASLGRR